MARSMGFRATENGRGAFRPSNVRKDPDGLFLAGGAAHPGPGMPMALMSGWIAADAVDRRYRKEDVNLTSASGSDLTTKEQMAEV